MKRKTKLYLLILIPLMGVVAGYLLMGRSVQASVNGQPLTFRTHALTVGGALQSAGVEVGEGDSVTPALSSWLSRTQKIVVNSARTVSIQVEPAGKWLIVRSTALSARGLLQAAGIEVNDVDQVTLDGFPVVMDGDLPRRDGVVLQYRPAIKLTLIWDEEDQVIATAAKDVGTALWEAGIQVRAGDWLSVPFDQPLNQDTTIELHSGRSFEVQADGKTLMGFSAGQTVGEALAEMGIALENLDYSRPGENENLPTDGIIQVVRVREEIEMKESAVPFESQLLADDTMEINTRKVVQEGINGIKATQVIVRYENGEEVTRRDAGEVILASPVARIVHYGTKITETTMNTPDGPITYYMAVNVTATSYSPCRSGVPDKCYSGTSLGLPVQKGVIGVNRAWYNLFAGSKIYVPGYGVGTIADIGYYPYADNWIDLGYSDADYQSWGATNLTVYFLSPAPAGFNGVLP